MKSGRAWDSGNKKNPPAALTLEDGRKARKGIVMRNYTIGERIRSILIIIALIANVIIWGLVIYKELTKPELVCGVDYFPMTNQHIEWTWAGKGGAGK